LARAGLFIVFASAIWALLPLIAQSTLHLGAGGYGLLLGTVGIGAVAGAALLPRLRARLSSDALLTAGSIGLAVVTLLLAYAHVTTIAAVALVFGGACWVLVLSVLNSMYQLSLPGWIKARGMSFYLMVFQGGDAVGSAIMGLIAERAGLSVALTIAAAGLALSPLAGRVWRFRSIPPETLLPAGDWPAPVLARPGLEDQLMTALQKTKDSRRRTGAISWRAWHDASDPGRVLEEFVVASWDDHLRQHERLTRREQAHLERVRELTDPDHPVVVTHWLAVSSRKVPRSPAKPT
jgi:MFS family permease